MKLEELEELQQLAPEAAKAIELNPKARYVVVVEQKIPQEHVNRIAEIFREKGFENIVVCCMPIRIYKLEA